jgi:hypothetical protein
MNIPNNAIVRRYLSTEASAKTDWLQLALMLVLLVAARLAQPTPVHATTAPRPSLSHYLTPAVDSSRFTIYDTRYKARFMLGHISQ